jgi:hypothetical protein
MTIKWVVMQQFMKHNASNVIVCHSVFEFVATSFVATGSLLLTLKYPWLPLGCHFGKLA